MRRRLVVILFLIILGGAAVLSQQGKPQPAHSNATSKQDSSGAKRAQPNSIVPDVPTYIRIPRLGLQAPIRAVGLNMQGNMASPDRLTDTAWYKPGVRPGEVGNAVIAGHYGKPHQAAFWNLNQLKDGDGIEIIDASKQILTFVVTDMERVNPDEAQRQRIFGASEAKHLNLITCDGAWDAKTHSYDLRLIVYTTLRQ